jgi:outer membrane lipoprotein-sorting protein
MNRGVRYNSFFCLYMLVCSLLLLIAAVPPAVLGSDAKADLKVASDAVLKVKSYRIHMTTSSQAGTNISTIEFVAPNRMHIIDEKKEMIIVPEGTYVKVAKGKWQKSPMDMSSMIAKLRTSEFTDEILKNEQVRLIGPDTLDGKSMMVYEIVYTSSDLKSRNRVWISTDDHLPYKSETDGEAKEFKMSGKTIGGKSKTTSLYTDYNAPIKIVAPTL